MRVFWRLIGAFTALFAAIGFLQILSCSKSGGGIDGDDNTQDRTPPADITDLQMVRFDTASVSLRWTARGDDGDSGRATAYDLRYSLQWITDSLWDFATSTVEQPLPGVSQSVDSCNVDGLLTDSTYYFSIRSRDEKGNESGNSNIVTVSCIQDYPINIADTSFERIVRFYAGKPTGDILRSDMLTFDHFNIWSQHIYTLSGIEHCRNLFALRMWGNSVTDLAPLTALHNLQYLYAANNGISDISPLGSLADMHTLNLDNNAIANVGPIVSMTGLNHLSLIGNSTANIAPLGNNAGLTAGDSVWLTGNPLTDPSTDSIVAVLRGRGVVVTY